MTTLQTQIISVEGWAFTAFCRLTRAYCYKPVLQLYLSARASAWR